MRLENIEMPGSRAADSFKIYLCVLLYEYSNSFRQALCTKDLQMTKFQCLLDLFYFHLVADKKFTEEEYLQQVCLQILYEIEQAATLIKSRLFDLDSRLESSSDEQPNDEVFSVIANWLESRPCPSNRPIPGEMMKLIYQARSFLFTIYDCKWMTGYYLMKIVKMNRKLGLNALNARYFDLCRPYSGEIIDYEY
jgi:hypothetical protein